MNNTSDSAPRFNRRWQRAAALCALLSLSACVVVPQTREVYDSECKMLSRQMTLDVAYLGGFQGCGGDACLALLTAAGAVTAASAVISGSIALVGNVVFWFEKQGRCSRSDSLPAPTPTVAAAPSQAVSAQASAPTLPR